MENRKTEYRKYALYTFLTLMIELSIASLMDMLLSKFESFYSAAAYVPMSDKLWHYGILKVICVTAALFLYFVLPDPILNKGTQDKRSKWLLPD